MKKKLTSVLKAKTGYRIAKELGCSASMIYQVKDIDPDAKVELDGNGEVSVVEYVIHRRIERES